MTPEKQVQNSIIRYLKQLKDQGLPLFYERRQAGGFSYKKGQADLYIVYKGIHIEIEIKRPGGHQSVMQEKWEAYCTSIGIQYICVDSVEELKQFLNQIVSSD